MSTCFDCGTSLTSLDPRMHACSACARHYEHDLGLGPRWYSVDWIRVAINQHRRAEYRDEQLAKAIEGGEYLRRLEVHSIDDTILGLLHAGVSTPSIVDRLRADKPGRSQATLYRKVRALRQEHGLWEGTSRR